MHPLRALAALPIFTLVAGAAVATPPVVYPAPNPNIPALHFLVIDDRFTPHVKVTWPGEDGKPVTLEADRKYTSPTERTPLGHNLECFVALGGARLDRQAGDPDGAIVRIGLYKRDPAKAMFEGLAENGVIELVLTNIVFDKPATAAAKSGVQHIKYSPEALVECGLGGSAFELFNTASPTDDLRGYITPENGRMGVLGVEEGSEFTVRQEADGSFTLVVRFPYALLRHVADPWKLDKPGTFLEPLHFHVEFEAVPLLRTPELLKPPPAPLSAGE